MLFFTVCGWEICYNTSIHKILVGSTIFAIIVYLFCVGKPLQVFFRPSVSTELIMRDNNPSIDEAINSIIRNKEKLK